MVVKDEPLDRGKEEDLLLLLEKGTEVIFDEFYFVPLGCVCRLLEVAGAYDCEILAGLEGLVRVLCSGMLLHQWWLARLSDWIQAGMCIAGFWSCMQSWDRVWYSSLRGISLSC